MAATGSGLAVAIACRAPRRAAAVRFGDRSPGGRVAASSQVDAADLANDLSELGIGTLALALPRPRSLVLHGCSFTGRHFLRNHAPSAGRRRCCEPVPARQVRSRQVLAVDGQCPFVSSPFLPNVISWMPILLATAVIDRPNRGGADGLVLVFLGCGVGVSPRDSCRRSYDAVPSGSGPVHVPPRPAMVLQRLAATPNSGSPATQRLLPTPGTGPPVATCCKPDTTSPATPRHHRGPQPTHGSQDHSRTHPLRRPTHTNPRTSSATPAHHLHHDQNFSRRKPFRMFETPDAARCRTSHIATSLSS